MQIAFWGTLYIYKIQLTESCFLWKLCNQFYSSSYNNNSMNVKILKSSNNKKLMLLNKPKVCGLGNLSLSPKVNVLANP